MRKPAPNWKYEDGDDGHYYYENETVQVLRLQYTENKASMFVVLPRERFGLDSLLESVDGKMLTKWFDSARLCPVKVQIYLATSVLVLL